MPDEGFHMIGVLCETSYLSLLPLAAVKGTIHERKLYRIEEVSWLQKFVDVFILGWRER